MFTLLLILQQSTGAIFASCCWFISPISGRPYLTLPSWLILIYYFIHNTAVPPSNPDAVTADACPCFFNQSDVFYTITAIIVCRGMCQQSQQAVMYVRWTSQTLPSNQTLLFVRNSIQVHWVTLKCRKDEVRGVITASFTGEPQGIKSYCINTIHSHLKWSGPGMGYLPDWFLRHLKRVCA